MACCSSNAALTWKVGSFGVQGVEEEDSNWKFIINVQIIAFKQHSKGYNITFGVLGESQSLSFLQAA